MTNKEKLSIASIKEAAAILDGWFELKPDIENTYCENCKRLHGGCPFGENEDGCDTSSQDIIMDLLLQKYSAD